MDDNERHRPPPTSWKNKICVLLLLVIFIAGTAWALSKLGDQPAIQSAPPADIGRREVLG